MSLEFVTSPVRWQEIYQNLPEFPGKIYYSREYYGFYQANGDGTAAAVYSESNGQQIFHPFLIKKIPMTTDNAKLYDLETAYGYGGPAIFAASTAFVDAFFTDFSKWAEDNAIVAEFVRFNPLQNNHSGITGHYQTSLNRVTVSINLQQDFSAILGQCSAARQRNYRHAIKAGLQFHQTSSLECFCQMYAETMRRLNADQYYFFSKAAFEALEKFEKNSRFFATVTDADNRPVATAVFLLDRQTAHYHLGASNPDYKHLQGNAFMMLEMAKAARENQRLSLHLGGGLTMQESDPLYRFKAGFSQQRHQFFIGRKIYDPAKYATLSQAWQQRTGNKPGILLHYHYGENHADL